MKYILLISMILLFTGCDYPEPVDNYKNGIVKEKYTKGEGTAFKSYYFTIQIKLDQSNKNGFKAIQVVNNDYIRYNVGDTIK